MLLLSWNNAIVEGFLVNIYQELEKREQEGQLDEGFLSEVNAQLRQVSIFGDFYLLMLSFGYWYTSICFNCWIFV